MISPNKAVPLGARTRKIPSESDAALQAIGRLLSVASRQIAGHDEHAAGAPLDAHVDRRDQSVPVDLLADTVDRLVHAATARSTVGLSPAALLAAYLDWAVHLAASPGKQLQLAEKARRKAFRLATYAWHNAMGNKDCAKAIKPLPQDRRFRDEAWQKWPFDLIHQAFLLNQQWWYNATTGVRGVTKQHEAVVEFTARQMLDMFSPSNFLFCNPEILHRIVMTGGMNLFAGLQNLFEDWKQSTSGDKPLGVENFQVGRNIAVTPGRVVYRNRLIELIQYAPMTDKVRSEPILIVPAWIMKYYILDLSPQNSLVKYLTEQGFTVFIVSWKNPTAQDRDLGMEEYRSLGVMAAVDEVSVIVPDFDIHAVGYCLGGTLLSIAAAAMMRDGDERLKTITLLAAQTDFTDAGELSLFINESQLAFLEDMMWEQGFLDTRHMSGAFQMLRSNDLVWSQMVRNYLIGQREPMIDLMAWNADATRMPFRMHSEYLRQLFLENELAEGRFKVGGKPVALPDIRVPIFAVATTADHVAPWRSIYKINLLTGTEVTYLLTSGGHNAGIVSPPDRCMRKFQVMTSNPQERYVDPDEWLVRAPHKDGSWWPEWIDWLDARSGTFVDPPPMGLPGRVTEDLSDAPGRYVLNR